MKTSTCKCAIFQGSNEQLSERLEMKASKNGELLHVRTLTPLFKNLYQNLNEMPLRYSKNPQN